MKKVFVSIALAAVALGSQAQIVKNDLLKGYKEGDVLRKQFIMIKKSAYQRRYLVWWFYF